MVLRHAQQPPAVHAGNACDPAMAQILASGRRLLFTLTKKIRGAAAQTRASGRASSMQAAADARSCPENAYLGHTATRAGIKNVQISIFFPFSKDDQFYCGPFPRSFFFFFFFLQRPPRVMALRGRAPLDDPELSIDSDWLPSDAASDGMALSSFFLSFSFFFLFFFFFFFLRAKIASSLSWRSSRRESGGRNGAAGGGIGAGNTCLSATPCRPGAAARHPVVLASVCRASSWNRPPKKKRRRR